MEETAAARAEFILGALYPRYPLPGGCEVYWRRRECERELGMSLSPPARSAAMEDACRDDDIKSRGVNEAGV